MATGEYIPRAFTQTYPSALGAILHAPYIWDTDYALSQDDQSYELMRRDAIVAHALDFRKHLAAGLDWHIDPASPAPHDRKVASILEAMVKQIRQFAQVRFNLAEAVIRGESWGGIRGTWVNRALAGGQTRKWWTITEVVDMDKRRFRPAKDATAAEDAPAWNWEVAKFFPNYRWERTDPTWYVHHTFGSQEAALGRGFGLGSEVWHYWRDKVECLKLWLQRLDRWALGNLVAKVALDEKSRRDPNNSTRVNAWMATLKKMRAGHICVFDAQDAIELVEATGDGSEISRAIEYFDNAIIRLCLGSIMPTGSNNVNGSYARADIEAESTSLIVRFDHLLLEETITRQIVELLYRANYRTILMETGGVEPSGVPEFRLRTERTGDPMVNIQIIEKLLGAGVALRLDEVYSKSGFTPPAPGEPVIVGVTKTAPALTGANPADPNASSGSPLAASPQAAQILARARAGQFGGTSGANYLETDIVSPKNRIAELLAAAKARARGAA